PYSSIESLPVSPSVSASVPPLPSSPGSVAHADASASAIITCKCLFITAPLTLASPANTWPGSTVGGPAAERQPQTLLADRGVVVRLAVVDVGVALLTALERVTEPRLQLSAQRRRDEVVGQVDGDQVLERLSI